MAADRPSTRAACPACLAGETADAGEVDGFGLRRCRSCSTLFTDRVPSQSEAEDYEAYYHDGNLDVPAFVHARLGSLVDGFAAERETGRWLDVGFGAGSLMRAAHERGWSVVGTEVASRPLERLRANGYDVRLGAVSETALEPASFDVVSLIEVVEHLPDPETELRAVARVLRPGGVAFMTTPHWRGISGRLLGTRWSTVSPPEHLQLFSVPGLRALLSRVGLRPASARTHALNPFELWHALRGGEQTVDRVGTAYALNAGLSSSRPRAALKDVLNAVLNATRAGDTIKCVARRPA